MLGVSCQQCNNVTMIDVSFCQNFIHLHEISHTGKEMFIMMDDLFLFRPSQLLGTLCPRSKTRDKQAFVHTLIVLVLILPLVFAVVMMAGDYRPQTASG